MPPLSSIDDIRKCRDAALESLGAAVTSLGDEIALTTDTGPYLDQLTRRYQDLMNERAAIREMATDAVLALRAVIEAATQLNSLSTQMRRTAQQLPNATSVLAIATTVLSLGQQFTDLIAQATRTSAPPANPTPGPKTATPKS